MTFEVACEFQLRCVYANFFLSDIKWRAPFFFRNCDTCFFEISMIIWDILCNPVLSNSSDMDRERLAQKRRAVALSLKNFESMPRDVQLYLFEFVDNLRLYLTRTVSKSWDRLVECYFSR